MSARPKFNRPYPCVACRSRTRAARAIVRVGCGLTTSARSERQPKAKTSSATRIQNTGDVSNLAINFIGALAEP